jgi:hypothetical protein
MTFERNEGGQMGKPLEKKKGEWKKQFFSSVFSFFFLTLGTPFFRCSSLARG